MWTVLSCFHCETFLLQNRGKGCEFKILLHCRTQPSDLQPTPTCLPLTSFKFYKLVVMWSNVSLFVHIPLLCRDINPDIATLAASTGALPHTANLVFTDTSNFPTAYSPLALLQLSTVDECLLIQMERLQGAVPRSLIQLLEDPSVLKAGLGISEDVRRLQLGFGIVVQVCDGEMTCVGIGLQCGRFLLLGLFNRVKIFHRRSSCHHSAQEGT